MNHHYRDIRDRIPEPPTWFDENAVPRYCEFGPDKVANIYAREVALVEIACQNCRRRFKVAFSWCQMDLDLFNGVVRPPLREAIEKGYLHYGDPPNAECCPAGPTMSCLDLRVLEFWSQKNFKWTREPILEREFPDAEEV